MFSGKSEELIRRMTRVKLAGIPLQVFKPGVDHRYGIDRVVSHSSLAVEAQPVPNSEALVKAVLDATEVIGVDEGQFFDDGLVDVAEQLALSGKQVIVAGLDMDYLARPFEPIPRLATRSEYVTKMLAVCHRCGDPAGFTQRIIESDDLVVLGATDAYEARCRRCFDPDEPRQMSFDS